MQFKLIPNGSNTSLYKTEQFYFYFFTFVQTLQIMKNGTNWIFFGCMILLTLALRIFQHPFNFTSVLSLSLLGAAFIKRKYIAWAIPFGLMWMTDMLLNNTVYSTYFDGFTVFSKDLIYTGIAFALIVLMGSKVLKNIKFTTILGSAFAASIIFFLVSNFGVWLQGSMYPKTGAGLLTCLEAGLPFFRNSLFGTSIFAMISFYGYAWFDSKLKIKQKQAQTSV